MLLNSLELGLKDELEHGLYCGFFLYFLFSVKLFFYLQMFDRIKPSDEASASSAQGEKFKVDIFVAVIIFFNVIINSRSTSSPCSELLLLAYFDFLNFIMELRYKK